MNSVEVFDMRYDLHNIAMRIETGATTGTDVERLTEIAGLLIDLQIDLQTRERGA